MSRALSLIAFAAVACSDNGVAVYNTPPTVSIEAPFDGDAFQPNSTIIFRGVARDSQQDPSTLLVSWTSSVDGELGSSVPDVDGIITEFPVTTLTGGLHAITLKAIDDAGEAGSATITIDVGYGGDVVGAPTVSFIGPVDGDQYASGQEITVVATATDDEQSWDTLEASLLSSRDGLLWQGAPASSGAISFDLPDADAGTAALSVGSHALTLSVEDMDGNVANATVNVTVLEDGRPIVNILQPGDGDGFWTTDSVTFTGEVSDDVSDNDAIVYEWSSDRDGVLATGSPDSNGVARASRTLSEGYHVIRLKAWDEDVNDGSDTIGIDVLSPYNHDGDGDGQTENQGDCDDTDPNTYTGAAYDESSVDCMTDADGDGWGDSSPDSGVVAGGDCDDADSGVSPGEPEVCDDVDNNCDGEINEGLDGHATEPNDTQGTAYDFGGVNSSWWPWSGNSNQVSGLVLNNPTDEDWFEFEIDDVVILEDSAFQIDVTGLPGTGSYTVEIENTDEGGQFDSQTGTGSLRVTWSDSAWSTDTYNDWVIRVYSTSWAPSACQSSYTLTVTIVE